MLPNHAQIPDGKPFDAPSVNGPRRWYLALLKCDGA